MELLVVRHGRAEDHETFAARGEPDSQRPLTAKGISRVKKAAHGLRGQIPSIDLVVSSPLRRAIQTARIIAEAYEGVRLVERDELTPGKAPKHLIHWLTTLRQHKTVCIVGHEPDLSKLIGILLADDSRVPEKIKKGSVTFVRFQGSVAASRGHLEWHRSAKELGSSV